MAREPHQNHDVARPLLRQWAGLLVVAIVFAAAAALTWRKWPDPLIDFGLQLYLPWKISTGSVLYRDVMYLTGGPLSQHFHALLFKCFGISYRTLIISNLVIAAGLLVLIYRRFLAASDAWTATAICLGIVLAFAFAQYIDVGNYNYLSPYCHEVWHGLALSIAAIALLSSWVTKERIGYAVGAGFCAGLVFMTKPEVFTALAAGVAASVALYLMTKGRMRFVLESAAGFALGGALPLLVFFVYFHQFEDWRASLKSVAFAWVPLLGSAVSKDYFYQWCLGLDMPAAHIRQMLTQFAVTAVAVAGCALLYRGEMNTSARRMTAMVVTAGLMAWASGFDWVDCGRSLPLLGVASCVLLAVKYRELTLERPVVFPLLWSVFGLVLLAKLGVFSRIWHYGFALAMPAFAGAAYLLLWLVPAWLGRHGVHRAALRWTVGLVLLAGFAKLFVMSEKVYHDKAVVIGRGGDRFLALAGKGYSGAGEEEQEALAWIDKNVPGDATLAVLPEGIMINYLSRRTNPTKYFVWNPAEIKVFGQANMVSEFERNSPDYILLVHREAAEYGVKYFGQEDRFGLELMQWIRRNYEPVCLIGQEPLQNSSHFGIRILKKLKAS